MTTQITTSRPVKKKKKKKNYLLRVLIFFVFLFCVYKISMVGKESVKTEIVRFGTLEDKINTDGYIVRNEYVIPSPVSGMLSCVAGEGERVNKNAEVAMIFEGEVDENLQSKINSVNERILEFERSEMESDLVVGDAAQIDTVISKTVDDVINAAYCGELSKVSQYKNDLNRVIKQKLKDQGVPVPKVSKMDELLQEKKKLESSAGTNKIDIRTPVAGVFSSIIDGYENAFDITKRELITPEVIAKADQMKIPKNKSIKQGESVVKIIDNYEWYYAATVDSRWIKDLKVGSYIKLRFPEITSKTLDANVDSISEEQNGKVTIIASCMQYENNIYSLRKVNCDIVRKSYSGFKVPKKAVRVLDDGTNGVYILQDGIAKFRQIEILYSNDEYVIVKENNQMDNTLLLYDEVIINGGNIEDGKIVK